MCYKTKIVKAFSSKTQFFNWFPPAQLKFCSTDRAEILNHEYVVLLKFLVLILDLQWKIDTIFEDISEQRRRVSSMIWECFTYHPPSNIINNLYS